MCNECLQPTAETCRTLCLPCFSKLCRPPTRLMADSSEVPLLAVSSHPVLDGARQAARGFLKPAVLSSKSLTPTLAVGLSFMLVTTATNPDFGPQTKSPGPTGSPTKPSRGRIGFQKAWLATCSWPSTTCSLQMRTRDKQESLASTSLIREACRSSGHPKLLITLLVTFGIVLQ